MDLAAAPRAPTASHLDCTGCLLLVPGLQLLCLHLEAGGHLPALLLDLLLGLGQLTLSGMDRETGSERAPVTLQCWRL